MSDFDELFNSITGSSIVDIVKDSKIVLVNEYDAVHPLKTGEYYLDNENNILYVGAGLIMKNSDFDLLSFLSHDTSVVYIPAPRSRTAYEIELPEITHSTVVVVNRAPRIRFDYSIELPEFSHLNSARRTTLHKVTTAYEIALPSINYESEVE